MLRQGLVQQLLVGFRLRQPPGLAQLLVGGRQARIQAENLQKQVCLPIA